MINQEKLLNDNFNEFLYLSQKYLLTSKALLQNLEEYGNNNAVISENEISEEELNEKTKYCDYNIMVPTLYLFYHGLELLMKGIIISFKAEIKFNHKLTELLSNINNIDFIDIEYKDLLSKYISNPYTINFIKSFIKNSSISIDEIYEALRYPVLKGKKEVSYDSMQYQGENIIEDCIKMTRDIDILIKKTIKIVRRKKEVF